MDILIKFLFASIKGSVPYLFGTTGEIVTEKAGNLNLGVEGMMCMGGFSGFYIGFKTGSLTLAIIAAFLTGALGAAIYAFLTVTMQANQNVTGLTLTIFGGGFSKFFGVLMNTANGGLNPVLPDRLIAVIDEKPLPLLGDIPVVGKLFFSHNIFVYLAIVIAVIFWFYIKKTRTGLNMRAVGENPAAADASGINVSLVKYINIIVGGGICGIGGTYISMISTGGQWDSNCFNGQGWIAVALVIFASWNPVKAIFGSFVFGMFKILHLYIANIPALGFLSSIPNAFFDMLPFLITAIILVISSVRKKNRAAQPASCGVNYFREER